MVQHLSIRFFPYKGTKKTRLPPAECDCNQSSWHKISLGRNFLSTFSKINLLYRMLWVGECDFDFLKLWQITFAFFWPQKPKLSNILPRDMTERKEEMCHVTMWRCLQMPNIFPRFVEQKHYCYEKSSGGKCKKLYRVGACIQGQARGYGRITQFSD